MLSDQLLQGEIASFDQGVINVVCPPDVKALVKGPTTDNRDADVGVPGGKAPDQVDDMVAIGTTLSVRFPVNLATVHSLIIAHQDPNINLLFQGKSKPTPCNYTRFSRKNSCLVQVLTPG